VTRGERASAVPRRGTEVDAGCARGADGRVAGRATQPSRVRCTHGTF
jgi:hypothetical protein